MENGNKLLASGKKLLSTARVLLFCFVFGLSALLITLLFCGDYATLYLALSGHYGFVNFLVGVFEFLIGIGSGAAPCYVCGMIFIGLGQLCVNTSPNENEEIALSEKRKEQITQETQKMAQAVVTANISTAKVSPMLINGIGAALKEPQYTTFVSILKALEQRLTKENERQIIQHILNAPQEEMRPLAQQAYDKLKDYSK